MPKSISRANGALFSPCRTWRYVLWRSWDVDKGFVAFCGLNPSTADETKNDPTVTRCINFAKAWGFGGMYMLNLFAYRATNPRVMKAAPDPVGPNNDEFLVTYSHKSKLLVVAWGTHGTYRGRGLVVLDKLCHYGTTVVCFGKTKDGHPKHPLYLPNSVTLVPVLE